MDINPKIVQRAIAKSLVNDTGDVIKLVSKYKAVSKNISYADLLAEVQGLSDTNNDFVKDLTILLIKKKRISDYNSAVGVVAAITGLLGSVAGAVKSGKEAKSSDYQASTENTKQLMQLIMQEEQARIDQQKAENNIIYISIGAVVLITGMIIFLSKK
jgi:hypothetical protein